MRRLFLGQCVNYLLEFTYGEIAHKRRVAIQTMAEVARKAAKSRDANAVIRQELLSYLEHSPFTPALEQLVRRLDPAEWIALLVQPDETGVLLLHSVVGARQLLGGCRRMRESYPDHPGLLFLSSLGTRLLIFPIRMCPWLWKKQNWL